MPLDACSRIAVLTKPGFLGDTIVATPLLRRLREAAPAARIALLAGPGAQALMRGCPWVDEVIALDHREVAGLAGTLRLARRLRARRFDAAFLVNRSLRSAVAAALARVPMRVGHATESRGPLLTVRVTYDWGRPDRLCALDLLAALGAPAEPCLPELWVSGPERNAARRLLAAHGVPEAADVIAVQPGAHDPEVRRWRPERFAEAADRLAAGGGASVALLGAAGEEETAREVAGLMRARPAVLAGVTGLREALAVIASSELWLGNDGGMFHAAVALGTPSVGVFGPTKAPRWGHYETPDSITIVACPERAAASRTQIRACLDAVTVERAVEAARAALRAPRRG
ncbi:MAG: lipopolysaccharide heptosyltransferase II [Chthonomonadales bacterium]|nr:lipopolysaccharide heptosyltransferase II [Chthonomonadales bacterium]